ncbi:hypothetical protein [Vibrio coralliirubri]|uniref:hypothetical protein n=1 Tax=Vibrio coralliirubri TaxID=1516159 RepID=UPI0012FCA7CB|nr:hypothetical protein [Vibrio coralliirubri]
MMHFEYASGKDVQQGFVVQVGISGYAYTFGLHAGLSYRLMTQARQVEAAQF